MAMLMACNAAVYFATPTISRAARAVSGLLTVIVGPTLQTGLWVCVVPIGGSSTG